MKVYIYAHSDGGAVVITDSNQPLNVLRKATGRTC